MILCVGCRSSRTGFSKTDAESYSSLSDVEIRDIDRSSLFDFSYLKSDTLRIHIIEYYMPREGDTSSRGPVKSETEIWYGTVTAADSSKVEKEIICEITETNEQTSSFLQEETQTETKITPWYSEWQFKLIVVIVVIILVYLLLRKLGFF
ncbi:MAG TPA: hypothetical protein DEQ30_02930 [Porphyromonadaceae bacterium]|nr:hypothetical protein [Porphyromonadaceae bacterium]